MRISTDSNEDCGHDWVECPHCEAFLADVGDDVSDSDYRDSEKDVAAVDCPQCGKRFALIREHSYRAAKFSEPVREERT